MLLVQEAGFQRQGGPVTLSRDQTSPTRLDAGTGSKQATEKSLAQNYRRGRVTGPWCGGAWG